MFSIKKINIKTKIAIDTTLSFDVQKSTVMPVLALAPLVVFVCMSLSSVGFTALSYFTFALLLLGFVVTAFFYLRNGEMSKYGLASLLMMLTLLLISMLNYETSDLKNAFYMAMEIWMFQMLCFLYKDRIHIIVIAMAVFLSFCVYANFIHFILHPNLWLIEEEKSAGGYLLGNNYNGMGFRFILAVTFCFVCLKYSWKWIFNLVPVIILSVVPLVLTGSKTSLAGLTILAVFSVIPSLRLQKIIANAAFIGFILFQVFVVFSGKGLENNELAVYIVEDVLDKDITFTYRTYLWDMTMQKIAESPIWGFGFLDDEWYNSNIKISVGTGPCNFILSMLLNGGMILVLLFVAVIVMVIYRLSINGDRMSIFIKMSVATIMIMHLMEMQSYAFVFFLLTLGYYSQYITSELKKQ